MATIDVTSSQLDQVGFFKVMRNFLMFPRQGWHFRLDQKPIGKAGVLSVELADGDGRPTGVIGFRISSFHVKRDNNTSFISQSQGNYLGKKIVVEEAKYVYFACAGGGVWQPIWGYQKLVQKHKGDAIWQPDNTEIDRDTWGFACDKARWFTAELGKATGTEQGIAMGPVQGAGAKLFTQL